MLKNIGLSLLIIASSISSFSNDLDLKKDEASLSKISQELQKAKKTLNSKNKKNTVNHYRNISKNWRDIYEIQHKGSPLSIDSHLDQIKTNPEIQQVKQRRESLFFSIDNIFEQISIKRFSAVEKLFSEKKVMDILFEKETLTDIYLEIKSVPLRWVTLLRKRYEKLKEDISAGPTGWVKIANQFWYLILVLIAGFISRQLYLSFMAYLKRIRFEHIRKSYREKRSLFIAKWISRIAPLLKWICFILFLQIAYYLIKDGYFKEITLLIPYFTYYSFYRIFRLVVKQLIASSSYYEGDDKALQLDRKKMDWTSRFLGGVFLSGVVLLHTFGSAGGKGLLYLWIAVFFKYFFIFIVFYVAYRWHKEIKEVARKIFTGKLLSVVDSGLNSWGKIFFSFPVFVLELIYHFFLWIYSFLERFDIIRAISAQYFRKKMESAKDKLETDSKPQVLPVEYLESFYSMDEAMEIEQKSQQNIFNSLIENINNWKEEKSDEHIALIYGEKGVGKTYLLKKVQKDLDSEETPVLIHSLKDRFSQKEQLNEIMSEIKSQKGKMIVVIDGLQYFFLSKREGFEHFKEFLQLTQKEEFADVFWCLGINNYSWEFLEAVLKKSRYFNFIYKLDRWREEDIQQLILAKHKQTGFELSYDPVLSNANRSNEDLGEIDVEGRYFRILWEETMGNPSVAIKIWLASLKRNGQKSMKALIPVERAEYLNDLPDVFYFVLATIIRHESMTIDEIVKSTDLSEDIVRNAVKSCLEKEYLVRKIGRKVGVSILSQHQVYSSLKRMNFIYG